MSKLTKREIEVCESFIEKISEYCKKQEDFYYKIAQNGDHSEDFVNRMTDMATSFHSVCQFVDICANGVFDELQSDALGDSTEVGREEMTATESPSQSTNVVDNKVDN